MPQFKCLQCDRLHFDEDAADCEKKCGGRFSRAAALIHWLIPTDEEGMCKASVNSEPENPNGTGKISSMVLACRPSDLNPTIQNRNVTTALCAVTCQECLQAAEAEENKGTESGTTENSSRDISRSKSDEPDPNVPNHNYDQFNPESDKPSVAEERAKESFAPAPDNLDDLMNPNDPKSPEL